MDIENKLIQDEDHVLTLERAKRMIGRKIMWTYNGYEHNEKKYGVCVIGRIMSEMEYNEQLGEKVSGFNNRADYWRSYMKEDKIKEIENTFIILDENGNDILVRCYPDNGYFKVPTFTCSDEDREVYFKEL